MELFHDFANYCDGRLLLHVSGTTFSAQMSLPPAVLVRNS